MEGNYASAVAEVTGKPPQIVSVWKFPFLAGIPPPHFCAAFESSFASPKNSVKSNFLVLYYFVRTAKISETKFIKQIRKKFYAKKSKQKSLRLLLSVLFTLNLL